MSHISSPQSLGVLPGTVPVLIAGGGPSGLFLALDLAHRGIQSLVIEPRMSVDPYRPRAKTTNARTMTHLRRLGLADRLREAAPLPVQYSQDVIFCSSLTGHEVARFKNAFQLELGNYGPQPECGQQVPQPVLENLLREAAAESNLITLYTGARVDRVIPRGGLDGSHIVEISDTSGGSRSLAANFVIGADGGTSIVRKSLGIQLQGSSAARSNHSVLFRSQHLERTATLGPAVQYWIMDPQSPGMIGQADLHGTWWAIFQGVDRSGANTDPAASIRAMAGTDIDVEIIAEDPWTARMLLAERYAEGGIFLVGDAAHLNPPWGGHGFNTCVGDAANLAWKLAGVLQGWADPKLLDSYESERRPVAARTIQDAASNGKSLAYDFADSALAGDGPEGEEARARASRELTIKRSEFHSLGLVLGYTYVGSQIVTPDGSQPPTEDPVVYEPSTTPGCLLPHAWLDATTSLYDVLDDRGFTLLVPANGAERFAGLLEELALSGIPITLRVLEGTWPVELGGPTAILVRPDQHIAWRGDNPQAAAAALHTSTGSINHVSVPSGDASPPASASSIRAGAAL
ncbi:2-polyprenyl-6-methoxyphenol hydroxylase [Pseudarthrobacter phenanthrenivorans]|uniref:2-polyprenyl-6-methoxyphenol hydroxylase-like oxidoreductase n=1 Tax=Pseudarthrobacter phenanthrenivorans (strain DSM 18606 / JCM 16027 / LMG 23796 / Sphe3) TaxID=930171 RepID=F0MAH6_PSEPM|nr:FAD-dependent monooxygenase [Pseudarthrobacter phenanthrenivorans]ADX72844.1 2-polyprenyl-6-methoxyphenol hydroxylase-like oxidoreductase [Pseudarthrobacter phenanthrenivorans Sphe3]TPV53500.1 2-polyprenyl-6-methoxyphenol hydroxylase [Pseudarthrobacter phenanthrenivorans]